MIYNFFDDVPFNSKGKVGDEGDQHFRCLHGNKVVTVKKKAKGLPTGTCAYN